MSQTLKNFHDEIELRQPVKVRLVHRFGGPERELDAVATTGGIFVHWPLSGLIKVSRTGHLEPKTSKAGLWRVCTNDLVTMQRRHAELLRFGRVSKREKFY